LTAERLVAMRRWAGLAILLLWTASLILPVFTTCRAGYDHVGGWFLLMFGWFGILMLIPAWFANFFVLAVATILVLEMRPPIWLGLLGAILAATAWWWTAWQDDTGAVPICHYHAGYWLWLAVAALAAIVPILIRRARTQPG